MIQMRRTTHQQTTAGFRLHARRITGGIITAKHIHPDVEPQATDVTPPVVELCDDCSQQVVATQALHVAVDRHYKPMQVSLELVEGWVEKLGGSNFPRWQRRFVSCTDKSVEWFDVEPKPWH